jgi:hypothetical protein
MIYVIAIVAFAVFAYLFSCYRKRKAAEDEERRFQVCEVYLETIKKYGINSDQAYFIKGFSDPKTLDLLKKIDQIRRGF